ncbi:MAG: tRNA (adenosine(37)-N6)-threonylcarbamoyltransferase complex dimerization subunit type 1 TsaB, partial [Acidobacteria bacterium]|nr:tRNA (adenosine(37)-N6)-threonylcarbamoyltransferase complex dimerization subunit type 1 TsaB [Acidobacteriota bacterium]
MLSLDTTTREGSVALVDDGRVVDERIGDRSRTHAERLPAELLAPLAARGWTLPDIDLFAVA